jgi:hypothetical protein
MTFRTHLAAGLALTAMLLALSACAPTVRLSSIKPARINAAAGLNKITVLTFNGPDGALVSNELKNTLENIHINGEPYFSVVREDDFYDIASGRKCRACKGGRSRLSLSKATGADAVLEGNVTKSSCKAELFEKKIEQCIERTILKKDAKPECTKWGNFYIPCVRNTATHSFSLRLVEISTGHYLYTDTFSSTWVHSQCQEGSNRYSFAGSLIELTGSRLAPLNCRTDWRKKLLQLAFDDTLGKARRKVPHNLAPYYETTRAPIMTSTQNITDNNAKELLKQGVKLASKSNLTTACTLWKKARKLSPESPSISYNLGLCAEFKNKLGLAEDLYQKAASLSGETNTVIITALERIAKAKRDTDILKEQLNEQQKNRKTKTK